MLKTPTVENLRSRSGRPVANQFLIYTDDGVTFQSYGSLIAHRTRKGQVFLNDHYWDYSNTTGCYRNDFLGESIAETRKKIESGEYRVVDMDVPRWLEEVAA